MKAHFLPLCLFTIMAQPLAAQVNRYLPGTWQQQPHTQSLQNPAWEQQPYAVQQYTVIRDFNVPENAQDMILHFKTVYKRIRINTQAAADSLTELVLPLEPTETPRHLQARVVYGDGQTAELPPQRARLKDGREAVYLAPLRLRPGCELEYDFTTSDEAGEAGTEYMQSIMPCEQARFLLVTPSNRLFRHRSSNGFPPLRDSLANGLHYLQATAANIPALEPGELFYYQPWLQQVSYALHAARTYLPDTVYASWRQPAEAAFMQFVNVDPTEYRRLEKEVKKWDFIKPGMPLPALIYQVEQHVKTAFSLVQNNGDPALEDLVGVLSGKSANERGFTRLLASVYYLLGVPCQLLFTAGRDAAPLDTALVNMQPLKHVLLYFPGTGQALSPTSTGTRYPYFPSSWGNSLALRCRDTMVNRKNEVLVDFMRTPLPDYTRNFISQEAVLQLPAAPGQTTVNISQQLNGYPGNTLREVITATPESRHKEIYSALLPLPPAQREVTQANAGNTGWGNRADQPFTLKATMQAKELALHSGGNIRLQAGALLSAPLSQQYALPPAGIPVELSYPFYQENRVIINLPPGAKVRNQEQLALDIHGEGSNPALGYKITCRQEGSQLVIYAMKWFRKTTYGETEKQVFKQILEAEAAVKNKTLDLSYQPQ